MEKSRVKFGIIGAMDIEIQHLCSIMQEKKENENQSEIIGQVYFTDIRDKVYESITAFLSPYLQENIISGKEKLLKFVDEKAPYYKPLLASLNKD